MIKFKLVGSDDIQLNVRKYLTKDSKAVIICVHGMCEHSNRYDDFARYLNSNNYSVYTYDHRGNGESLIENEKLGYLGKDGFNKMVYDLDIVVSYVKEKHENSKVYILGHSMGSFVTQRYMQMFNEVDGVILSGSNFGVKTLGLGILLSKLTCIFKGEKKAGVLMNKMSFSSYNKSFAPNRTDFDWLNTDEKEVDKYINDDYCGYICSNRFYYDFLMGLKDMQKVKNLRNLNKELPLFIIAGDQDPVGNYGKGVRNLYNTYSKYITDVKMKLYDGARHEILNEINKKDVYQDILNWLESKNK